MLLRTDFSDGSAWLAAREAVERMSSEGFRAYLECISDPDYEGLTIDQLLALTPADRRAVPGLVFLVDRPTLASPECPVLVVDLRHVDPDYEEYEEPGRVRGRSFRVIAARMWSVQNNLSLSNMDWEDFADNVDADGVFRAFPRS